MASGNKVRPIDDLSASRVNAATTPQEKLAYDTLDMYFAMMQEFEGKVKVNCLNGNVWHVHARTGCV